MGTAIGLPFFGIIAVATTASRKALIRDLRVLKRIQLDYPVYFLLFGMQFHWARRLFHFISFVFLRLVFAQIYNTKPRRLYLRYPENKEIKKCNHKAILMMKKE
jgi:hypothetical protein